MRVLFSFFLSLLLLLPTLGTSAQNNAYQIDDDCYRLFQRIEALAGTVSDEQFNLVNDSLLQTALARHDEKAQVLFYVERLKHSTRSPLKDENRILKDFEKLKTVSSSLGYKQYFYYAYDLLQTYYYNNEKANTAVELLKEMQAVAI